MFPPKFDYYRANSVSEALSLMQEHDGAKVIAGGHSLIPALKLRLADPGVLIDIGRISELKGISANGSSTRIGALTTHAMVAASSDLPQGLTEAAGWIGDPQVRNVGTVGGNIAHADPASDLPTVLTALGATINITSASGERGVAAQDFFLGLFETALQEGELVSSIEVPTGGGGSAYAKLFNPASRYAVVGCAAQVKVENGICSAASVAVGGLTSHATKAAAVEAALLGKALSEENIKAAAAQIGNDLGDDVMGDIHASEEYRRNVAPIYVAQAISAAAARAS
ncbi:MAG: xanthine dehydrogenase family protein subunit M [Chloroflexota bacterium]|nr:xanthine dehydrogenase family protein subunit M [Chloroflexota bacterium]